MFKKLDIMVVGVLLGMGVLTRSLTDTSVNSNGLNKGIYYDNIEYSENVNFNGVDGLNMDYSAQLNRPGDYYELYFDIVNSTSFNVEIADYFYNEDDQYIAYELTYENGDSLDYGDIIKRGESKRLRYKVLYKEYILDEDYSFDTSFNIQYEQAI